MKVTFDKNVYEFVADPQKAEGIETGLSSIYYQIHEAIRAGRIEPYISESILTYESIAKVHRQEVLSHPSPFRFSFDKSKLTVSSNPEIHPGLHQKDEFYLNKAIALGFKILPGRRFGKLVVPFIQNKWYYLQNEDYLKVSERFTEITQFIDSLGCGYSVYHKLTCPPELAHLNILIRLQLFKGSKKELSSAIAEWSDGDSVALHLTNNIDILCSNDHAKNAKLNSVFHPNNVAKLAEKFQFKKVTPAELLEVIK